MKLIVAAIVLGILALIWLSRKSSSGSSKSGYKGPLTIYGSMGCGWTKKQLDYCDSKNIPYKFVDCDSDSCPSYVKGYPTMDKDGQIIEGFKEL
ncbi:hypothetical protein EBT31_03720 [bacterium]|nr:hypothetical protein [bacterium]NBX48821.1 hypothetical protein [bacterium]